MSKHVEGTPHLPDANEVWRRRLAQRLDSLRASGVQQLPRPRHPLGDPLEPPAPAAHDASPSGTTAPLTAPVPDSPEPVEPAFALDAAPTHTSRRLDPGPGPSRTAPLLVGDFDYSAPRDAEARRSALEILRSEVAACTLCAELARTRRQTVFAAGNPMSDLVFIGEAPGADEDRIGEPFVGRAGQLLTRIIEACGMKREEVYIINVLKCRPPNNRTPTPQEAALCRPFLEQQLTIVAPRYIVCLGSVAGCELLQRQVSVGALRGTIHSYRGASVVVTYHPSYLLRTPQAKALAWDDMKMLLAHMGRPIPTK